jgi:uncharacterized protein (DUF433 family)
MRGPGLRIAGAHSRFLLGFFFALARLPFLQLYQRCRSPQLRESLNVNAVTCYMTSLYVIHSTCAPNFGEGQLAHGSKTARHWVSDGPDVVFRSGDMKIFIECKHFRKTVERNVAAYRWGKERITSSPDVLGGEPVFRGTRIPLEHVAALFRKDVPDDEIAEDFPALDERDLAYARLAARLGQPPGRPKKRLRIEREPGARR